MLPEQLGYIAIVIGLFAAGFYVKDTLLGKTKPNRVSWSLWALAPLIGVFFQLKAGAGLSVLPIFMAGFGPVLVVLASFVNKNAYWKITRLDIVCGTFSLIALVIYVFMHNLSLSILFVILSDLLAGIPILVKSWKFPETETSITFILGTVNSIIGMLIIKDWSFVIYSFGLYLIIINSTIVLFLYRKKIFKNLARV